MGLFSRSKKIRSTYEAETLRKVFREDYEIYTRVEQSADLKRFNELSDYVNSPMFKNRRKQIEQLSYKDSEYYKSEKQYKKLLKSERLRSYYLIKESPELVGYLNVKKSDLYEDYAKLKVIVNASGFDKRLRPDEYIAYKKILLDPKIKALIRFEKKRKFRRYAEISLTKIPQEFEQLAAFIQSDDFKKNREYLLNKKRYLTTEDYQLLCEYENLKKRQDIVKYFSLSADAHFNRMIKWKLAFEDDFNTGKLDDKKWITRYYAGERFLEDTYGVGNDVQLYTRDNLSFNESAACLNFRKESIIGKYWDKTFGVREKKYEYTSALLSTACSYRMCGGRFEAKIKLCRSGVNQYFWMKGDTDLPHVEIMENGLNGVMMGNVYPYRGNIASTLEPLKDVKLSNDYYIFTLEWTKEKMVWMINDTVVKEITENIPDIPMYVVFSLGTNKEPSEKCVPAKMEIDWVRFYKQRD